MTNNTAPHNGNGQADVDDILNSRMNAKRSNRIHDVLHDVELDLEHSQMLEQRSAKKLKLAVSNGKVGPS